MAPASISWLTSECSDSISPKTKPVVSVFSGSSGDMCIAEEVRLPGVLIQETTDSEQFWVSSRTGYESWFCHLLWLLFIEAQADPTPGAPGRGESED